MGFQGAGPSQMRRCDNAIEPLFFERWSPPPRAFAGAALPGRELAAILEAARQEARAPMLLAVSTMIGPALNSTSLTASRWRRLWRSDGWGQGLAAGGPSGSLKPSERRRLVKSAFRRRFP